MPNSWQLDGIHNFAGPEGIFQVSFQVGDVIDPERLARALSNTGRDWRLSRTIHGVVLAGDYDANGNHVLTYCTRIDSELIDQDAPSSEVQGTYVLRPGNKWLAHAVRAAMSEHEMRKDEWGTLDQYGHAAHGPIPVVSDWYPPDDDNTLSFPRRISTEFTEIMVGGGFLNFHDPHGCCGVFLAPYPWTKLTDTRVRHDLSRSDDIAIVHTEVAARVFGRAISRNGISYRIVNRQGHVAGEGAYWNDRFDQVWRVHYYFGDEHRNQVIKLLSQNPIASA
jgi:hypothetical protein